MKPLRSACPIDAIGGGDVGKRGRWHLRQNRGDCVKGSGLQFLVREAVVLDIFSWQPWWQRRCKPRKVTPLSEAGRS